MKYLMIKNKNKHDDFPTSHEKDAKPANISPVSFSFTPVMSLCPVSASMLGDPSLLFRDQSPMFYDPNLCYMTPALVL